MDRRKAQDLELRKLIWVDTARRLAISARVRIQASKDWETGLSEGDMDPIQVWCQTHECGRRISFDTFQFKSRKEMDFFLLKWSDHDLD
jgi:hypothetical protein